jgi:membrane-bound lytic murein transglycosylase A
VSTTGVAWEDLPGWRRSEIAAVWPAFLTSARAIVGDSAPLRAACPVDEDWRRFSQAALDVAPADAADFVMAHCAPEKIAAPGFLTGYYEPVVEGARTRGPDFNAPILQRPADLVNLQSAPEKPLGALEGARRLPNGTLAPYPTRAEIEAAQENSDENALVWLRDAVEVFLIQVQGSARVRLTDGAHIRLVYDGRNGRPYTSIGKSLIARGAIAPDDMSLAALKNWLRANDPTPGGLARSIMQSNESYVFFRAEPVRDPGAGPTGGQGVPLTPGRSIAIDRALWPYGGLFWIAGDVPSMEMSPQSGRLWVAQDTGSAIVGPARADLFIGTGDAAGVCAGAIRHSATLFRLALKRIPAQRIPAP